MDDHIFKDVIAYEDYFQISNRGYLYSKRTNKILKTYIRPSGYECVATKVNGTNLCFRIHRLVAQAFIPNPLNKPEVNHKDGNKLNNNVENLEWTTSSENMLHAYDTGLANAKAGIDNTNAKLTIEDIKFIKNSMESCRKLGKIFNVHHTQISRVKRNVAYKNADIV